MAYEHLAYVYDALMADAPYGAWQRFLSEHMPDAAGIALDLGCGTGAMARWLAARSRLVYAIDRSPEMLAVAAVQAGHLPNVLWLEMDVCDLELPEAADFALAATEDRKSVV